MHAELQSSTKRLNSAGQLCQQDLILSQGRPEPSLDPGRPNELGPMTAVADNFLHSLHGFWQAGALRANDASLL